MSYLPPPQPNLSRPPFPSQTYLPDRSVYPSLGSPAVPLPNLYSRPAPYPAPSLYSRPAPYPTPNIRSQSYQSVYPSPASPGRVPAVPIPTIPQFSGLDDQMQEAGDEFFYGGRYNPEPRAGLLGRLLSAIPTDVPDRQMRSLGRQMYGEEEEEEWEEPASRFSFSRAVDDEMSRARREFYFEDEF